MNYFNYFSEIEELFVRRRGRNLLLSPLDWALIESWQERQVPLHIILRGIERVFDAADRQANRRRPIKSLLYCKEEIEAEYAEWLERQIGKNGGAAIQNQKPDEPHSFSAAAVAAHLEKVSLEIKNAQAVAAGDWRKTLDKIAARLIELKRQSPAAEELETSLAELDELIDESLRREFKNESLNGEIEKQIAQYKNKMEPEVYRRTFDLMLLKRLREQRHAPRLSLFYL